MSLKIRSWICNNWLESSSKPLSHFPSRVAHKTEGVYMWRERKNKVLTIMLSSNTYWIHFLCGRQRVFLLGNVRNWLLQPFGSLGQFILCVVTCTQRGRWTRHCCFYMKPWGRLRFDSMVKIKSKLFIFCHSVRWGKLARPLVVSIGDFSGKFAFWATTLGNKGECGAKIFMSWGLCQKLMKHVYQNGL